MKRSRSCAVLLAASAAVAMYALPLAACGAPATQPADPAITPQSQPVAATEPSTTSPATQTSASAVPSTFPSTTQAALNAGSTQPSSTQVAATNPSATQESATQPAALDHLPDHIRLNFRDTPLDVILEHLSQDA